jgi:hypothetical protein
MGKIIRQGKKFAAGFGLPPVLCDIVKRRFVRVPHSEPGPGGPITLRQRPGVDGCGNVAGDAQSPAHDWPLNRGHRTDLEKLVFSARFIAGDNPSDCAGMSIGNVNDQVS